MDALAVVVVQEVVFQRTPKIGFVVSQKGVVVGLSFQNLHTFFTEFNRIKRGEEGF